MRTFFRKRAVLGAALPGTRLAAGREESRLRQRNSRGTIEGARLHSPAKSETDDYEPTAAQAQTTKRCSGEDRVPSTKEELGRGIRKAQALAGELEAARQDSAPALLHQPLHVLRPFATQVEAGHSAEFLERPTLNHAQPEGGCLPGAGQRGQLFA